MFRMISGWKRENWWAHKLGLGRHKRRGRRTTRTFRFAQYSLEMLEERCLMAADLDFSAGYAFAHAHALGESGFATIMIPSDTPPLTAEVSRSNAESGGTAEVGASAKEVRTGAIKSAVTGALSADDPGFSYGDGYAETSADYVVDEDETDPVYLEVRMNVLGQDVGSGEDVEFDGNFVLAKLHVSDPSPSVNAELVGEWDYQNSAWNLSIDVPDQTANIYGIPQLNYSTKFWVEVEDGYDVSAFADVASGSHSGKVSGEVRGPGSLNWTVSSYVDLHFVSGDQVLDEIDTEDTTPPTVTDVTISGSNSVHDPYSFDDATFNGSPVIGSGNQLRTVPVGGADSITVTFSEEVFLLEDDLSIIGLRTGAQPTVADFTLDGDTATWVFDEPFADEQYLIKVSDFVSDAGGNFLDGEWYNPASLGTSYDSNHTFPSGDGNEGGDFDFVFTILSADFNRDLSIDFVDLNIWLSGGGTDHAHGDANGDGSLDIADLNVWLSSPFTNSELATLSILANLEGSDYDVDQDDVDAYDTTPVDFDGDNTAGDVDDDAIMAAFADFGIDLNVFS